MPVEVAVSGGGLGWFGDGVKELGSHFSGMFRDDNAGGSNAGQTQGTGSRSNQERGRSSNQQGTFYEQYTEQELENYGMNALRLDKTNNSYHETLEIFNKVTEVDVVIRDIQDVEVAIVECKSYGPRSKWTGAKAVNQVQRLVYLADVTGMRLIFSTADGTTDCFGRDVLKVLDETQSFVISADNIEFANPSDVKETGVTRGLPPEFHSHQDDRSSETESGHSSDSGRSDESSKPEGLDSSSEPESDHSSDPGNTNSQDSGGSWLGGLISIVVGGMFGFGGNEESSNPNGVNSSSAPESDSNPGDSGGSLFGGWFGGSSDPESDGYGSSDPGDSGGYDSGSGDSSDSGSSGSGDSGGYDSGSSDSSDYGSSDSGDSGDSDSGSSSDSWW
ncbi:MAG: hypothetical protein MUC60_03805 [Oscillatoria sp. Prado101]|nr:hypothetical protein [Oscillatoria sp. Prado101]